MPNDLDKINQTEQSMREWGQQPPPPPVNPIMPPLGSQFAIPHFLQFNAVVNLVSRTYDWASDSSLQDCPQNAEAMLGDAVIADALDARFIPVTQLDWHLEAADDSDPQQVAAVANLTQIIKDIPEWTWYLRGLLWAIWYGKAANQSVFGWDMSRGYKRLVVNNHVPVIGDKIVVKFDSTPGILCHATYPGTWETTVRGRAHFFHGSERQVLCLHKFQPKDADFYDYRSAGAVNGLGLRAGVYSYWVLKARTFSYLIDFLQRIALGYTIYYYQDGNAESLAEVKAAAQTAVSGNAILFPRKTKGDGPGIERLEPGMAGADLFSRLITGYFDDIIRQYILGQTLTTTTAGTGMGSGVAEAHQDTQEFRMAYDARALGETLTEQLVKVLCRWNHPGVPCPKFMFDVDKPNVSEYMEAAQMLYEMGVTLDADDLRSVTGLPKPEPNHEVVSRMVPEQPATIGQAAAGVPVAAPGSPEQAAAAGGSGSQDPNQQVPPAAGQLPTEPGPPVVRQSRIKEALIKLARRKRAALIRKTGGHGANGHSKKK